MSAGVLSGYRGHFHEVGFYASDEEFRALIMPFVEDGITIGEPVIIGYDERKSDLIRSWLDDDPSAVTFNTGGSMYATPPGRSRPAKAVRTPRRARGSAGPDRRRRPPSGQRRSFRGLGPLRVRRQHRVGGVPRGQPLPVRRGDGSRAGAGCGGADASQDSHRRRNTPHQQPLRGPAPPCRRAPRTRLRRSVGSLPAQHRTPRSLRCRSPARAGAARPGPGRRPSAGRPDVRHLRGRHQRAAARRTADGGPDVGHRRPVGGRGAGQGPRAGRPARRRSYPGRAPRSAPVWACGSPTCSTSTPPSSPRRTASRSGCAQAKIPGWFTGRPRCKWRKLGSDGLPPSCRRVPACTISRPAST